MSRDARAFNWDSIPVKTGVTADPAAGASATFTVPAGKRWLFLGGFVSLVAAAAAANRYVNFQVASDGTNNDLVFMDSTATIISETVYISFSPGGINTTGGASPTKTDIVGITVKGIEMPAGTVVAVNAANLNAGDNFSVMRYRYKEVPV